MIRVALKREYRPYEVVIIPADGPHKQYVQPNYAVAELPEGDWRMTKCGDKIVFADASGNNPAMTVDKDGKWEALKPSDQPPASVSFTNPRVILGGAQCVE